MVVLLLAMCGARAAEAANPRTAVSGGAPGAAAQQQPSADVIVVGAGIAGLAAAQNLSRAGLRVVVLEARNRTGGRLYSVPTAAGARSSARTLACLRLSACRPMWPHGACPQGVEALPPALQATHSSRPVSGPLALSTPHHTRRTGRAKGRLAPCSPSCSSPLPALRRCLAALRARNHLPRPPRGPGRNVDPLCAAGQPAPRPRGRARPQRLAVRSARAPPRAPRRAREPAAAPGLFCVSAALEPPV